MQNNDRIFGLDLLRATAILLVLFSHIHYLIDSVNPMVISLSGVLGYSGVELFFVLSGFLIGSILLKMYVNQEFTAANVFVFLKRRWFRTLPNYYLVLLLNILLAYILRYDFVEIWKYFFFVQNFSKYSISIFPESWSLSVEEWTYVIMPIVLLVTWKLFKNKKIGFLFSALLIILFTHLHRIIFQSSSFIPSLDVWNTNVKALVIYRIDTIVFGFLIAWLHFYYTETLKKYSMYLFIIAGHLFFLQFFAMNVLGYDIISSQKYFLVYYFTLSSITFALSLPIFIYWNKTKSIFSKPITFISKVSYSAYLLHYSLIAVGLKYLFYYQEIKLNSVVIIVVYLTSVFGFSYLLYRFYEYPIMQLREKNKIR